MLDSLDELLPDFNVIHQIGRGGYGAAVETTKSLLKADLLSRYRPVPFLEASVLHQAMSAADIIISRAGSTSIHEIAMHGKPSILIPIPEEISHDQRSNAYAYAQTGAATVMEEENLTDGLLVAEITRIISDRQIYEKMSAAAQGFAITDAAERLSVIIRQIGMEHE
jgi:UDP-N-acetylglucosamine--N-acetylmuramyl-(pentapeptide) pyrophosphoryl-undecaprenol N-acetylglucosamine transferase